MGLDERMTEYKKMWADIMRAIENIDSDSKIDSMKHKFMITNEDWRETDRIFHICVGEIKDAVYETFKKYVENPALLTQPVRASKKTSAKVKSKKKVSDSVSVEENDIEEEFESTQVPAGEVSGFQIFTIEENS